MNTIRDREWTEPLPIYAFAIEHPEGVIVVDTGESAGASQPGYFPRWHPGVRLAFREWVEPEQEIGPQLERLGISPGDVRRLVMTHLHTDHAGGLHHFPDSEILVTRTETRLRIGPARPPARLRREHALASLVRPTLLELEPEPFGAFPQSLRLTDAGDVTLVPVPGHTPGQIGVLVDDGDHTVFLAGDSSYTQDLMLRGKVDGVGPDERSGTAHPRTNPRLRHGAPDRLPGRARPGHRHSARRTSRSCNRPDGGGGVIAFQTSIGIERPVEEVFAYVSDPSNLPSWNSAVRDVRPTLRGSQRRWFDVLDETAATDRRATNQLEVVASKQPHEFAIRTTAGPTPFLYRYRFGVENGETSSSSTPRSNSTGSRPACPNSHDGRSSTVSTTTSRR